MTSKQARSETSRSIQPELFHPLPLFLGPFQWMVRSVGVHVIHFIDQADLQFMFLAWVKRSESSDDELARIPGERIIRGKTKAVAVGGYNITENGRRVQ